jgi:5-formyltetrahydrofolate cyclo-ligase
VTTPNDDSTKSKTEIRAMIAQRRQTLRVGATDVRASAVAINGIEIVRAHCQPGSIIAAFSSFGNEPPTDLLVSGLVDMGYRVILPRVINDTEMTWHHYDGTWTTDTLGISTPATPDEVIITSAALIFIPAVAASQDGRRLGRGGGYYDRMLEHLPVHEAGGPFRCAVIDAPGLLPNGVIPMDSHDAWVDGILVG